MVSVLLCQVNTIVGDLEGNSKKIIDCVRSNTTPTLGGAGGATSTSDTSGAGGAPSASTSTPDFMVFPEMTLTGYPLEDLALRNSFSTNAAQKLDELIQELRNLDLGNTCLVFGTIDTVGSKPVNQAVMFYKGEIIHRYNKQSLPNYGVFDEYRVFAKGNLNPVTNVGNLRVATLICEDIWGDDAILDTLGNVDLLLVLNASPFEIGKSEQRFELVKRIYAKLGCPVVYVNQVGGQDDLIFDGGSFAYGSELNPSELRATPANKADPNAAPARATNPNTTKTAPTLTQLPQFTESTRLVKFSNKYQTPPPAPQPAEQQIYNACVLGLRDYARKNGFKSVVLGFSGGIDSALCAAMAADALGGENVLGLLMPSKYSSVGSIDDANELVTRIGAQSKLQPINEMYNAYEANVEMSNVAKENIQARIRGNIVMAYSNTYSHLALATGNKSELAVGYSTIYGDAVGGYAPIKDLNKSLVFQISKWRNSYAIAQGDTPPIPENSITKPPSAELREDQTDQDTLPEYDVLDEILELYIEKRTGSTELIKQGFDENLVHQVVRMVDLAEWKRRQYPIGPKITNIAFGRDRRLPITVKLT
jgi:NAD+ synthase (glutamine-hydrolysing)